MFQTLFIEVSISPYLTHSPSPKRSSFLMILSHVIQFLEIAMLSIRMESPLEEWEPSCGCCPFERFARPVTGRSRSRMINCLYITVIKFNKTVF